MRALIICLLVASGCGSLSAAERHQLLFGTAAEAEFSGAPAITDGPSADHARVREAKTMYFYAYHRGTEPCKGSPFQWQIPNETGMWMRAAILGYPGLDGIPVPLQAIGTADGTGLMEPHSDYVACLPPSELGTVVHGRFELRQSVGGAELSYFRTVKDDKMVDGRFELISQVKPTSWSAQPINWALAQ